jgi:hypothetical protein
MTTLEKLEELIDVGFKETDTYAMKQGLYVLAHSGENVTLLNHAEFQPRIL